MEISKAETYSKRWVYTIPLYCVLCIVLRERSSNERVCCMYIFCSFFDFKFYSWNCCYFKSDEQKTNNKITNCSKEKEILKLIRMTSCISIVFIFAICEVIISSIEEKINIYFLNFPSYVKHSICDSLVSNNCLCSKSFFFGFFRFLLFFSYFPFLFCFIST